MARYSEYRSAGAILVRKDSIAELWDVLSSGVELDEYSRITLRAGAASYDEPDVDSAVARLGSTEIDRAKFRVTGRSPDGSPCTIELEIGLDSTSLYLASEDEV